MGDLLIHVCDGIIDVEAYIGIVQRHTAIKMTSFLGGKIIPSLILHVPQQIGLLDTHHGVDVLEWPA